MKDAYPTEFRLDLDLYEVIVLYWPGYPPVTCGSSDRWDPGDSGEFELLEGTVWDDEREEFVGLTRSELDALSHERSGEILDTLVELYESERYSDRERWESDAKSAWEGR